MSEIGIAAPTVLQMIVSLYAYLLPLVLCTLWASLALWDVSQRKEFASGATVGWTAILLLLPFIGPLAYFLGGKPQLTKAVRLAAVAGGGAIYLLVLLLGRALGGID